MKTKDRKKNIYVIIFVMIIIITILIFINIGILKKKHYLSSNIDKEIKTSFANAENLIPEEETENKDIQNQLEENIIKGDVSSNNQNKIETTYKGYPVIAKLEIPKINLETYVISEYSNQALGVSVTKFYGGNPNEVGNFCIAGHNYITKNMFHDLKKLENEDTILLTGLEGEKVQYRVYVIETVAPNETQCLSQKTNGKIELTLITCTTDSSKRIIVKAVKD